MNIQIKQYCCYN